MSDLRRGDAVSDRDGDVYILWSVTLGVAHCFPVIRDERLYSPNGIPTVPATVLYDDGEGEALHIATDRRRHFPADDVTRIGKVSPGVVDALELDNARQVIAGIAPYDMREAA